MASKALTLGARRPVFDQSSAKKAPGREIDWYSLLLKQDAEAIHKQIAEIVRTITHGNKINPDQLTQDLFLHLLSSERFRFYLDNEFTDDQIRNDILSLI